jgi:hypothetical protein
MIGTKGYVPDSPTQPRTMAKLTPVLPAVPSVMRPPGCRAPDACSTDTCSFILCLTICQRALEGFQSNQACRTSKHRRQSYIAGYCSLWTASTRVTAHKCENGSCWPLASCCWVLQTYQCLLHNT